MHRFVLRPALPLLAGAVAAAAAGPLLCASAAHAAPAGPALDCRTNQTTGAYPPSAALITLSRTVAVHGQSMTLTASGFAKIGTPGHTSRVVLTVCSAPQTVGSVAIAADGSIADTFAVPRNLELGDHLLAAVGPNGHGGTTEVVTDFTVVAAGGAGDSGSSSSGDLPFTGAEIGATAVAGLVLVGTGATLVVAFRRRRDSEPV